LTTLPEAEVCFKLGIPHVAWWNFVVLWVIVKYPFTRSISVFRLIIYGC
jgi:hypothetical protein